MYSFVQYPMLLRIVSFPTEHHPDRGNPYAGKQDRENSIDVLCLGALFSMNDVACKVTCTVPRFCATREASWTGRD
jgi:hypothetical protein